MRNLIKDNIGILLKSINFENILATENNTMDYADEFKVAAIQSDVAEFHITRKLVVDLQIAYNLQIIAGVQIYAQDGVDLTKELTDEVIEKHKDEISKTIMSFTSALITQITGSFNGFPVITTPVLRIK